MRVLTIFARHGTARFPGAEERLAEIFADQLPDVARDVVVVDSALGRSVCEEGQGRTVLGSDNAAREFSAFERGVAFIGPSIWDYDLVNLATAAFAELYDGYLRRFRAPVLDAIAGQPVCLGHIDCYNEPIDVLGYTSQHWLRTSCVFLPPAELRMLPSLRPCGDGSTWFSGIPEDPFRAEAPLSVNYRRLIIEWLTGGDIGQGVRWHSQLRLDAAGLPTFEHKAQAILNEHLLGVTLRAAGCRCIDVTWLATVLERGEFVDWDTPWWEQLQHRDHGQRHVVPAISS